MSTSRALMDSGLIQFEWQRGESRWRWKVQSEMREAVQVLVVVTVTASQVGGVITATHDITRLAQELFFNPSGQSADSYLHP
ncbi:hypothetical protein QQF64_020164 [Cirrhinus molitorella]|uniref:Uncharacterized protein n=1 Tax=Cirrhinus molitorella TaxID=172907 RepID=A0ABR3LBV7_9TELE